MSGIHGGLSTVQAQWGFLGSARFLGSADQAKEVRKILTFSPDCQANPGLGFSRPSALPQSLSVWHNNGNNYNFEVTSYVHTSLLILPPDLRGG